MDNLVFWYFWVFISMKKKVLPSPPAIRPIRHIPFPEVEQVKLSNGLVCYHTNMGTQELMRIEYVAWAGRPYERHPLVARATASLLKEGTLHRSGAEIAEHFDYYGASMHSSFQLDTGNLSLYSLNKHLPAVLPMFIEVLCEPAYHDADLQAYIRRKQHSMLEDLSKADVLAYRQITAAFFGEEHPYGYNSTAAAYQLLNTDWLKEHHRRCFHAQNGFVLISGRFDDATLEQVHTALLRIPPGSPVEPVDMQISASTPEYIHIPHAHALQSAIRMGQPFFHVPTRMRMDFTY
ncbi:MAG: hypothetical protein R2795_02540 [Saprospiraceae bacterium]